MLNNIFIEAYLYIIKNNKLKVYITESNGGGVYKKALLRNFILKKFLKYMVLCISISILRLRLKKERNTYSRNTVISLRKFSRKIYSVCFECIHIHPNDEIKTV